MSQWIAHQPASIARVRDWLELGKPRLSSLVLFTAASGVWAAPEAAPLVTSAIFVFATFWLVVAANTLNCWIEREIDALMPRTRNRPLPAGRLDPRTALFSGVLLAVAALATLAAATNLLTTLLGAIALFSYVLVYTPLKRVTPWSLLVGALPGALPPLMGWTAATGSLAAPGWFLFGILFFWQLPHFIAISLYSKEDFRAGGLRVMSVAYGDRTSRRFAFLFALLLVGWTLLALPLGLAGAGYTVAAALLGLPFVVLAAQGLAREVPESWARLLFGWSLLYLPLLIAAYLLG